MCRRLSFIQFWAHMSEESKNQKHGGGHRKGRSPRKRQEKKKEGDSPCPVSGNIVLKALNGSKTERVTVLISAFIKGAQDHAEARSELKSFVGTKLVKLFGDVEYVTVEEGQILRVKLHKGEEDFLSVEALCYDPAASRLAKIASDAILKGLINAGVKSTMAAVGKISNASVSSHYRGILEGLYASSQLDGHGRLPGIKAMLHAIQDSPPAIDPSQANNLTKAVREYSVKQIRSPAQAAEDICRTVAALCEHQHSITNVRVTLRQVLMLIKDAVKQHPIDKFKSVSSAISAFINTRPKQEAGAALHGACTDEKNAAYDVLMDTPLELLSSAELLRDVWTTAATVSSDQGDEGSFLLGGLMGSIHDHSAEASRLIPSVATTPYEPPSGPVTSSGKSLHGNLPVKLGSLPDLTEKLGSIPDPRSTVFEPAASLSLGSFSTSEKVVKSEPEESKIPSASAEAPAQPVTAAASGAGSVDGTKADAAPADKEKDLLFDDLDDNAKKIAVTISERLRVGIQTKIEQRVFREVSSLELMVHQQFRLLSEHSHRDQSRIHQLESRVNFLQEQLSVSQHGIDIGDRLDGDGLVPAKAQLRAVHKETNQMVKRINVLHRVVA